MGEEDPGVRNGLWVELSFNEETRNSAASEREEPKTTRRYLRGSVGRTNYYPNSRSHSELTGGRILNQMQASFC